MLLLLLLLLFFYLFFFTRGRYDPSGGFIVIITIIMSGRSGLVLCGQKCALKINMIEALNADGKPLEEKEVSRLLPVERDVRLPISPIKSSADRLY